MHVVAARLGHADPAITLRVYAHVIGSAEVTAAEVFAQVRNSSKSFSLTTLLKTRINKVVEASGYSRTLIEAVRGGKDMWTRG